MMIMQANIVDAVLIPVAAADEGIGTTDGGGDLAMAEVMEKIVLEAVVEVMAQQQ